MRASIEPSTSIGPQISWGTTPVHTVAVDQPIPHPSDAADETTATAWADALRYMDLRPGQHLEGIAVQHVFIGSCTNSRIEDLESAATVVKGRRVAEGVRAWVVPGSETVRREAERRGLDQVFTDAGFAWRRPGCSMCMSMNGETVPAGERCISTSNRNFVGRQGPGARTHLASPASAAAAAVSVGAPGSLPTAAHAGRRRGRR